MTRSGLLLVVWCIACMAATDASAQPPSTTSIAGAVRDVTGGVLPGVTVEARGATAASVAAVTDAAGQYRIDSLPGGSYQLNFTLVNFATVTRNNVAVRAT